MRGAGDERRRRLRAWALVGLLATLSAASFVALPAGPARADLTAVPGTMSTAAQNTSSFAVPVPDGVEVRAITGVVTMDEVVEGGTITFRINGAVRETVPSALYQKVRIPVDPADVIADGTIGLTMTTEGPLQAGATCVPRRRGRVDAQDRARLPRRRDRSDVGRRLLPGHVGRDHGGDPGRTPTPR